MKLGPQGAGGTFRDSSNSSTQLNYTEKPGGNIVVARRGGCSLRRSTGKRINVEWATDAPGVALALVSFAWFDLTRDYLRPNLLHMEKLV